jgi:hypothetical protein
MSRTGDRASTKAAIRKACQNATQGIIPRERRRWAKVKLAEAKSTVLVSEAESNADA